MASPTDDFWEFIDRARGWQNGFLALAVKRGRSLWSYAAVPEDVVKAANPVAEIARSFVVAVESCRLEAGGEDAYRSAVDSRLETAFDDLTRALGGDVTSELRTWLTQNFVDHDERMRLWLWTILLPRLAGAYGGEPTQPPPLPPAAVARFRAIVQRHFNRDLNSEEEILAIRARLEPLSPLERTLLTVRGPALSELELPAAERRKRLERGDAEWDVDEIDVVELLLTAARNQRFLKAWNEINAAFEPRERALLVAWAREEGRSRKMPLQLITIRSVED
jgi:hypothetical protein